MDNFNGQNSKWQVLSRWLWIIFLSLCLALVVFWIISMYIFDDLDSVSFMTAMLMSVVIIPGFLIAVVVSAIAHNRVKNGNDVSVQSKSD